MISYQVDQEQRDLINANSSHVFIYKPKESRFISGDYEVATTESRFVTDYILQPFSNKNYAKPGRTYEIQMEMQYSIEHHFRERTNFALWKIINGVGSWMPTTSEVHSKASIGNDDVYYSSLQGTYSPHSDDNFRLWFQLSTKSGTYGYIKGYISVVELEPKGTEISDLDLCDLFDFELV